MILADKSLRIKKWLRDRMTTAVSNPPTGVIFDDEIADWINQPSVRSYEADLFRRLCIGYHMMASDYHGGSPLLVTLDDRLRKLLNDSLAMRRRVMDADLELIRSTFWMRDLAKSQLVKEVSRMITSGDYQSAKRWIIENLEGQDFYDEYEPEVTRRGRKGVVCRIGLQNNKSDFKRWGT